MQSEGLTVSALNPVEKWFGVPYAPLIAALLGAVLLSMLLTMLFTRSGLFKRRSAAVAYFADAPETKGPEMKPDDTADKADDAPKDDMF